MLRATARNDIGGRHPWVILTASRSVMPWMMDVLFWSIRTDIAYSSVQLVIARPHAEAISLGVERLLRFARNDKGVRHSRVMLTASRPVIPWIMKVVFWSIRMDI